MLMEDHPVYHTSDNRTHNALIWTLGALIWILSAINWTLKALIWVLKALKWIPTALVWIQVAFNRLFELLFMAPLTCLVFAIEYLCVREHERVEVDLTTPSMFASVTGTFGGLLVSFFVSELIEKLRINAVYSFVWSCINRLARKVRVYFPFLLSLSMLKDLKSLQVELPYFIVMPLFFPAFLLYRMIFSLGPNYLCHNWFYKQVPRHYLASNHHVYGRLNVENPTIRLLRLLKGQGSEPIECQVIEADVHSAQFEALSYAWGGHLVLRRQILVDRKTFWVTQNVFLALRSLRRPDADRALWIDQVCINQFDDSEKTDQVTHKMHHIYHNAERVIVWLGNSSSWPESSTSTIARAFEHAKRYSGKRFGKVTGDSDTMKSNSKKVKRYSNRINTNPEKVKRYSNKVNTNPRKVKRYSNKVRIDSKQVKMYLNKVKDSEGTCSEALQYAKAWHDIFRRKWFRRVWVVQEVALASEIVVMFGANELDWKTLTKTARDLEMIDSDARQLIDFVEQSKKAQRSMTLLDLAMKFCRHEATDVRDKLFGFLALAEDGEAYSDLTYCFQSSSVFANFTTAQIEHSQRLEILALAENPAKSMLDSSDCTWTPHWHELARRPPDVLWGLSIRPSNISLAAKYCASADRPAVCRRESESALGCPVKGIFLQGWHVDTVKAVSVIALDYDIDSALQIWKEFARNQISHDADFETMFESTIVGDIRSLPSNKASEIKKNLCHERRFFVTVRGKLGVGPSRTSAGDHVCIFDGSGVPQIIRKWRDPKRTLSVGYLYDSEFDFEKVYHLVGQTVLSGCMYASSADIEKQVETGSIRIGDILLR